MATAVKIKKIVEVLLIDGTLTELETCVIPRDVYVLSTARGIFKFAHSEKVYLEFKKAQDEANEKRKIARAEKQAKREEENKAARNANNTLMPNSQSNEEAEKLNLTYVKGNVFSEVFANSKGEQFMWLPKSRVFISLSPITNKDGDAFLGETYLSAKSPNEFGRILQEIQAEIPTQEQYEEFVGILLKLTGTATIEGFSRVCSYIPLAQQLCSDAEGKYKTYLNERVNMDRDYPWYNLACRKVLKQIREA